MPTQQIGFLSPRFPLIVKSEVKQGRDFLDID